MAYDSLPYIGGSPNSPEWRAKRGELFKKRGGKCEHCGRTLDFSSSKWRLHHKDNNPKHSSDDNLEILCVPCHFDAHPDLAWAVRHKPLNFELASVLGLHDAVLLEAVEYLERCFSRGYEPKWHRLEQAGIQYKETDDGRIVLTYGKGKAQIRRGGGPLLLGEPLSFELASAIGFPDDYVLLEARKYVADRLSRGYEPNWHRLEQAGIKCEETDDGVVLTLGDGKSCVWRYERGQNDL